MRLRTRHIHNGSVYKEIGVVNIHHKKCVKKMRSYVYESLPLFSSLLSQLVSYTDWPNNLTIAYLQMRTTKQHRPAACLCISRYGCTKTTKTSLDGYRRQTSSGTERKLPSRIYRKRLEEIGMFARVLTSQSVLWKKRPLHNR